MPPGRDPHPVYKFGPFRANFHTCEIFKHGIRVLAQYQPIRVLGMLVERAGHLVARQEIVDQLWPGHTANEFDDSLNATVKKLREALGDDAVKPLYVETVPRRGYRFIAPVQEELEPALPLASLELPKQSEAPEVLEQREVNRLSLALLWLVRHRIPATLGLLVLATGSTFLIATKFMNGTAANSPVRSIVVLPFENLSGDGSQDYFAEGMTDAVTTDLAQMGFVKVISRSSANHYKNNSKPVEKIRQELGVDAVVEGTVARSGNKVRVNVQVISAADDRHVWAQSFERDEGDILALQDALAQSVAGRIQAAIAPVLRVRLGESHPVNIDAYEAYLTGLHSLSAHRTNADLRKSLEEFDSAIALDPKLAKAYAGKATTYNLLGDYDEIQGTEAGPKAEAAARKALELDPSLASAHAALAFAVWKYNWDWNTADAEFEKSIALNPNNAHTRHIYAIFLACRGDFPGAGEELRKAQELDPLSMIIRTNRGWLYYFQHDYAKAESAFEEVLKLDPSFLPAHQKLWITYALDGKKEQAARELENLMRLFGHRDLLDQVEKSHPLARYQTGVAAYIQSGVLTPYERARYLALLGRNKEAVQALSEAAARRSAWMIYLGIEPAFDHLRKAPEFENLVHDARVPENNPATRN
jgi:TolB-like protein/DNA-binding winged helix-turn-helix (wHTH) protein/Tfp pilus assembly protein PilF